MEKKEKNNKPQGNDYEKEMTSTPSLIVSLKMDCAVEKRKIHSNFLTFQCPREKRRFI